MDFVSKKLKVKVEDGIGSKDIINKIKSIVIKLEPDVIVTEKINIPIAMTMDIPMKT